MINPMTVMKMLNERHQFIQNHPNLYPFLKENFGADMPVGTIIEIAVKKPGKDNELVEMEVQMSDKKVLGCIQDLFR